MKCKSLKELKRSYRILIVLSVIWIAIFGFGAASKFYIYNQLDNMYEDARVNVVMENLFEAGGAPSSDDVRNEKEKTRDQLDDYRNVARKDFFYALFLLVVGPLGIYMCLFLVKWILSGESRE